MPTISMFYGILVSMYALDVERGITLRTSTFATTSSGPSSAFQRGDVLEGSLPARQMKLVEAWIEIHRDELMADWVLAASGQMPYKIDPLR